MSAVRVVLAVLLTAGLLAVGLPAAERATQGHAATRLDGTATALDAAAERLARRNDATRHGDARRVVTARVPAGGALRIEEIGIAWRVDGGPWHHLRPRVPLDVTDGPLHLDRGRHRIRLVLRRHGGGAVVTITRQRPSLGPGD